MPNNSQAVSSCHNFLASLDTPSFLCPLGALPCPRLATYPPAYYLSPEFSAHNNNQLWLTWQLPVSWGLGEGKYG